MLARTAKIASNPLYRFTKHLPSGSCTIASLNTTFPLNSGARIPAIGLSNIRQRVNSQEAIVLDALKAIYGHIDTARIDRTVPAVGGAIKKGGITKSEIFVTTKLWV